MLDASEIDDESDASDFNVFYEIEIKAKPYFELNKGVNINLEDVLLCMSAHLLELFYQYTWVQSW